MTKPLGFLAVLYVGLAGFEPTTSCTPTNQNQLEFNARFAANPSESCWLASSEQLQIVVQESRRNKRDFGKGNHVVATRWPAA
jgi:hypothetical protein